MALSKLSKETQKDLEDIAFKIGLCQMALIYKHYELKGYESKEYYVNRIKELRAKILFTYMLEIDTTPDPEY